MSGSREINPAERSGGPRLKLFAAIAIVTLAIAYLTYSSVGKSSAYYLTIGELRDSTVVAENKKIRVNGTVIGDSIQWDARQLLLDFELTDGEGTVAVTYRGARPDMFRDGAEAIVEGRYTGERFEASSLFMKCPSKYEDKATSSTPESDL